MPRPALLMGGGDRRTRRLVVLAAGVLGAAWYHPVRRVEVVGSSMAPALRPGDRLVVVRLPWRPPFGPIPGQVVAVRDPRSPDRILIKRVRSVDRRAGTLVVEGDDRQSSTDSRSFGPVSRSAVVGRAVYRYAPAGRNGAVPGSEEYDRA
ncbi:MAG TPA: nickel-type superoxide dismutase maturation protease [Acidimicrobiales bacterium]